LSLPLLEHIVIVYHAVGHEHKQG